MASFMVAAPSEFTKFEGQMHGLTTESHSVHHSHQTFVVGVPHGMIIETSKDGESIKCCGGRDNKNTWTIKIPPGIHVEPGGSTLGEWGVFNVTQNSIVDPETNETKGYTLFADRYCKSSVTLCLMASLYQRTFGKLFIQVRF